MAQGTRLSQVRLGVDPRPLDRGLVTARGKLQKWGAQVRGDLSRAMRGAFGGLTSIAGFAGLAGISIAAKQVVEFEKRLTRLGIAARLPTGEMALLRRQIMETAVAMAQDPDELLLGIEKFVSLTGDVAGARDAMASFAKVATATGSSVEDITTSAAAMSQNMHIAGGEMEQAFSILLTQGKEGAVELRDMAQLLAGLTPQFAQFGKTGTAGLADMGAMLQVMRRGFGTSSEAATGLQALMTAVAKNAGKIQGAGIKVFDTGPGGVKRMRELDDIVFALIEKTKGNPLLLQKLLGRQEAVAAVLPLMAAGRAEFDKMAAAGADSNEVAKDFATYMDSAAGKTAKAGAAIKKTFSDLLAKHIGTIARAFEAVANAIKMIADHKWEALGVLAMFKGGSFFGGLGGAMGALGGGAGGGGLGGAAAGGGWAGGAAAGPGGWDRLGSAMNRAALGLAVASTIGKDLDGLGKGTLVASHAMSALPGPLGVAGLRLSLFADGLLLLVGRLNAALDEEQRDIVASKVGGGLGEPMAAERFLGRTASTARGMWGMGVPDDLAAMGRGTTTQETGAGISVLRTAKDLGALNIAEGGAMSLDLGKARAALAADPTLSEDQRTIWLEGMSQAMDLRGTDPEFRERVAREFEGPRVPGFGRSPLRAAGGEVGAGAVLADKTASTAPLDPRKEAPIHLEATLVVDGERLATKVANSKQRRRSP